MLLCPGLHRQTIARRPRQLSPKVNAPLYIPRRYQGRLAESTAGIGPTAHAKSLPEQRRFKRFAQVPGSRQSAKICITSIRIPLVVLEYLSLLPGKDLQKLHRVLNSSSSVPICYPFRFVESLSWMRHRSGYDRIHQTMVRCSCLSVESSCSASGGESGVAASAVRLPAERQEAEGVLCDRVLQCFTVAMNAVPPDSSKRPQARFHVNPARRTIAKLHKDQPAYLTARSTERVFGAWEGVIGVFRPGIDGIEAVWGCPGTVPPLPRGVDRANHARRGC